MNKIKKLFSGIIDSVKSAFNLFPLTIIFVFSLTLITTFLVIGTDFSEEVEEMIAHILLIGVIGSFGTWLTESIFEEKKDVRRYIGYIVSLIIAVIIDRLLDNESIDEYIVARWVSEYLILCILSTIYVLLKKCKATFEKYALNVLLNLKRAGIIYGILAIGFLILYLIFTTLILDTLDFEVYLKILCLFTGFYLVPVALKAFAHEEAEDTKFNKTVFTRVLLPMLFLAMLIVYIYIVKILLVTEMPKNQLFSILSLIFVTAYPIYTINKNYSEKGSLFEKINKSIPYLFTPFIFLQIYTMGIRIKEYGLTESRYAGIVLIVFEIIAILLTVFKDSKYIRELLIATMAISVVVMISPFNYERMPLLSQKAIVDHYVENGVEFDKLSEKDKNKFAGAYQYIDDEEEFINPKLSKIEKEKLYSHSTHRYAYQSEPEEKEREYVFFNRKLDNVDISEFKKVYDFGSTYESDGTSVEYYAYDSDVKFKVDLTNEVNKLIEANEISEETGKRIFKEEIGFIDIGEGKFIYLKEIAFTYQKADKKVTNLRIEGYMFEK